ncbi:MAG: hypothetical protein MPI95_07935 [Nitrosopumilus sp.]|nr:hypothetical protein [Nitrosopumilus sp.]MDA7960860.1 hypothetical protein [Nitrosopumilus sp.]
MKVRRSVLVSVVLPAAGTALVAAGLAVVVAYEDGSWNRPDRWDGPEDTDFLSTVASAIGRLSLPPFESTGLYGTVGGDRGDVLEASVYVIAGTPADFQVWTRGDTVVMATLHGPSTYEVFTVDTPVSEPGLSGLVKAGSFEADVDGTYTLTVSGGAEKALVRLNFDTYEFDSEEYGYRLVTWHEVAPGAVMLVLGAAVLAAAGARAVWRLGSR